MRISMIFQVGKCKLGCNAAPLSLQTFLIWERLTIDEFRKVMYCATNKYVVIVLEG